MESENLKVQRELTVRGSIRKCRLNRNQYTIALMNDGLRSGMLSGTEIMRLQNDFLRILQDLIWKYTQGESTSVATDTAASLMSSMMYAADAYLFSLEEPETAIAHLQTIDVRVIYDRGVEIVRRSLEETRRLYREILAIKLEVPVEAYNLTIEDSIPAFIKNYGILFGAHNTMASIDYPLAVDDMRLQGVFYIKQYLERLKLETEFCALFDRRELLDLLARFGRVCRFNYRIELFNIFELVLDHAIFSVLSGGDADEIRISESQFERLKQRFADLSDERIHAELSDATGKLQQQLPLHSQLKEYMNSCLENLAQRVTNAARHGSLSAVILADKEEKSNSVAYIFNDKMSMSDVRFRGLLNEIQSCETKEKKVQLILLSVQSFHDLLDLLESDCLYGDEYEALFHEFGDAELAILAKIVFNEELRNGTLNLTSMLSLKKAYSMEWQIQFVQGLKGMSRERLEAVDKHMDASSPYV
ncbi:DUF6179 domain-containing protein [Paenibacillaceae bacterium WGS1546]|uniref:DUF6179 domain-containing protein n=1 Tax=Cohnella sp. WGS1546 TaxID=3366810 RepID=UPI00372D260F